MFVAWVFGGFVMFVGAFVRTRSIHTPFSPSVRLIISVRRSLHRLCECLWSPFSEREMFTHFIRLFICVCRLGVWGFRYVLERGVFTHVSDRRGPRQLGDSSRVVTIRQLFLGVGVYYLKFTSVIPFRDMTSGVTVEIVGNDS